MSLQKTIFLNLMGISKSEWTNSSGTNTPAAASGLRLTSRDMLKFGILYYNDGEWESKQIVPKEWVRSSLTSSIFRSNAKRGGYGYQFGGFNYTMQNQKVEIPTAVGNGDQKIYIDKINDLIVVMTAGNYNKWDIKNNSYAILKNIYKSLGKN